MRLFYTQFFILSLCTQALFSQTYLHETTGLSGTYVGDCMVNTCSGDYYDDGGAASNYSKNVNSIYRVFCPSTAGNCISVTFNSFVTQDPYNPAGPSGYDCWNDYLTVGNGSTQNSSLIAIPGVTTTLDRICGTPATPFTVTSTSTSGCLSFRFVSDNTTNYAGWAATIACTPCAVGPDGTDNTDCVNATAVCSDVPITTDSPGPGLVSESCTGCTAGGENYSNWYTFTMATSGVLAFWINPSSPSDDYDFALYGPGASCGSLGTPLRCSYAATTGHTGLNASAADFSEGVTGDGKVATLAVTGGQTYYLMINHWTPPTTGYTLNWNLTSGATLDCDVLPIVLSSFTCDPIEGAVNLEWTTASEINNDYFTIEKSQDGLHFNTLATVDGQIHSSTETTYWLTDAHPFIGTNYYRLSQTDLNGKVTRLKIISCQFGSDANVFHLSIYDLGGRSIFEQDIFDYQLEDALKSAQLVNGIYIYKTLDNNGNLHTGKFFTAK